MNIGMMIPAVLGSALVVGLAVAWLLSRRADTQNLSAHPKDPSTPERRIVFKTCPDCRELVFLEAHLCKYCGCSFEVSAAKVRFETSKKKTGMTGDAASSE